MTAKEIYDHFRINIGLREHMLRVAAVAKYIGDHADGRFDTDYVVKAALVHDLGNIVKVKFDFAPEVFEPEGVEYYQQVQVEVIAKYGANDHDVTLAMMKEIAIPAEVIAVSEATVLTKADQIERSGTHEQKLMQYADMRVAIQGIVSLAERYAELTARTVPHRYSLDEMQTSQAALEKIEQTLFADLSITPEQVTDASTASIQSELLDFTVV